MTNDASGSTRVDKQRSAARGAGWLLAGSAVGGVGAYAFQLVGTRSLGSEAYAPISVLWTLLYLLVSIPLYALETSTVRATTLRAPVYARRVLIGVAGLAVVAGAGVAAGGAGLLRSDSLAFPAALAVTVLAYGVFVLVRGVLAGTQRSRDYGLVTAAESVVRIIAALVLLALFPGDAAWLAWALPLGPAAALLWWRQARRALQAPREVAPVEHTSTSTAGLTPAGVEADAPAQALFAPMVVVNAVSQTLLAGGPLAMAALDAPAEAVSIVFVTSTLARAPLVFLFGGLLSRLTSALAELATPGGADQLRRVARAITAGGVVAAAAAGTAAWFAGPVVVAALFGAGFEPSRWLVTAYAAGVLLAATALALTQVLLAEARTAALIAPWALAAVVATAALALRLEPENLVPTAFFAAEAAVVTALALTSVVSRGRPRAADRRRSHPAIPG